MRYHNFITEDQKLICQLQIYTWYRDGKSLVNIEFDLHEQKGWRLKPETIQEMLAAQQVEVARIGTYKYETNYISAVTRLLELYTLSLEQLDKEGNINIRTSLSIIQEIHKIQGLHNKSPYEEGEVAVTELAEEIRNKRLEMMAHRKPTILNIADKVTKKVK